LFREVIIELITLSKLNSSLTKFAITCSKSSSEVPEQFSVLFSGNSELTIGLSNLINSASEGSVLFQVIKY